MFDMGIQVLGMTGTPSIIRTKNLMFISSVGFQEGQKHGVGGP